MNKIKVAIVGVGNCASSLVQGIYYYKNTKTTTGLLYSLIGDYSPSDIEIVAAFDIDVRKVRRDVSEAIFALPNNTKIFYQKVPKLNVKVLRGPTEDGFSENLFDYNESIRFVESKEKPVNVTEVLKKTKPDMLINYLPVGSEKASRYYAECCLKAGVSFINAIPVFIASNKEWASKFSKNNLICVGDDIKSQLGATIIHRSLTDLFEKRGVKLINTYQLNVGGNTDFLNMLDKNRLKSKKISKTEAVQSQLNNPLNNTNIHIGPSDFVPWLKDNKVCFIRMEGRGFGEIPIELDLRLSVEDSPNSAGEIIDVVRLVKLGLDRGYKGYLDISTFYFKHPQKQLTDEEAFRLVKNYIISKKLKGKST